MAERSVHRSRRKPLLIALATGLVAFVIGAVVLTSFELVFGDASVASGDKRTTVFGGGTPKRPPDRKRALPPTTTGPATETQTETAPAPVPPTVTKTTPRPAPSGTTPPSGPSSPATPAAPGSGPTEP